MVITMRTMSPPSATRRPRCAKRPRDPNSVSSHTSFQARVTTPSSPSPASPSRPLQLMHKRHRATPSCHPQLSHYTGPGPPYPLLKSLSLSSSSASSTTTLSFINTSPSPNRDPQITPKKHPVELPDEVLVAIFRFIDHASRLAHLRTVCKQWCKVIDDTPDVWRIVSFKNADFSQPVGRSNSVLKLGRRPGQKAVATAARSGNEWARFLKKIIFDRHALRAVTTPQPIASLLVSGERPVDARPFPPWVGDTPESDGTWIAIHAARRMADGFGAADENDLNGEADLGANGSVLGSGARGMLRGIDVAKLPCGAMVGMIHVRDAFLSTGVDNNSSAPRWIWRIDRAVRLKKPIRCAGFVGLWSISGFLTDLLVNAMQKQ